MKTTEHLTVLLLIFLSAMTLPAAEPAQPNVLFIAVDDLNAWVTHLGRNPQAHTPNIDRLAKMGTTFSRAYCAVPACNPARAALMTGQRPWTTACYLNGNPWKQHTTEGFGLSAQFKKAGGEKQLGQLPGVLSTRIGSLGRKEVVDVQFDPTVISFAKLLAKAQELECARTIFARTDEQLKIAQEMGYTNVIRNDEATDTSTTQQHHLAHQKAYHYLPLTALQATKVNASLANKEDPSRWLSPTQKQLTRRITLLLERNPQSLESLTPVRSPIGIIRYAAQLQAAIKKGPEYAD